MTAARRYTKSSMAVLQRRRWAILLSLSISLNILSQSGALHCPLQLVMLTCVSTYLWYSPTSYTLQYTALHCIALQHVNGSRNPSPSTFDEKRIPECMCMCMCACVYEYVYGVSGYICVFMRVCIYAYMFARTCTHILCQFMVPIHRIETLRPSSWFATVSSPNVPKMSSISPFQGVVIPPKVMSVRIFSSAHPDSRR